MRKRISEDIELIAMNQINQIMAELDQQQQIRVGRWLLDRYAYPVYSTEPGGYTRLQTQPDGKNSVRFEGAGETVLGAN